MLLVENILKVYVSIFWYVSCIRPALLNDRLTVTRKALM